MSTVQEKFHFRLLGTEAPSSPLDQALLLLFGELCVP